MDPVSENSRTRKTEPRHYLAILLVLITLFGMPVAANADDQEKFREELTAAIAAQQKAAAVGGEWRDTEATIAEAQSAARKGNYQLALALARWAAEQGRLGYLQAMAQRDAGFPPYFRKQSNSVPGS